MSYKAKDADRLNDQNEKFRSEREKQLKKEIEQATREPTTTTSPNDSKIQRGRKLSSSASREEVSETAPSICPSTPLEAKVRDDHPVLTYDISPPSLSPSPPSPPTSQDVHDNEVSALCFNNQGNLMATGGADKVVKVWHWREAQGRQTSV